MEKRFISKSLVIVMMLVLFISGLVMVSFAASGQEEVTIWFLTMPVGTSVYSYSMIMSQIMKEEFPPNYIIELIPRGGGESIPTIIDAGGADIGLGPCYMATMAYKGTGVYKERGEATNIRGVTGVFDIAYTWILARKSYVESTGYTTLEEMFSAKELPRVGMKPMGSVVIPIADTILSTVGTSIEELRALNKLTQAQTTQIGEMLRDGRFDVYFEACPLNHPGLTEVTLTSDMVFIPLPQKAIELLVEDGEFIATVPPNAYKGLSSEYVTTATGNAIIANKNVSEDMIYLLIKALVERREDMVKENVNLSVWNPEEYLRTIPLHPGAKRYYDERGW